MTFYSWLRLFIFISYIAVLAMRWDLPFWWAPVAGDYVAGIFERLNERSRNSIRTTVISSIIILSGMIVFVFNNIGLGIKGTALCGIGYVMNVSVIIANKSHMPTHLYPLTDDLTQKGYIAANYFPVSGKTRLNLFCDRICVSNSNYQHFISPGDVVILVGTCMFALELY